MRARDTPVSWLAGQACTAGDSERFSNLCVLSFAVQSGFGSMLSENRLGGAFSCGKAAARAGEGSWVGYLSFAAALFVSISRSAKWPYQVNLRMADVPRMMANVMAARWNS